jgi:hypothetical protein
LVVAAQIGFETFGNIGIAFGATLVSAAVGSPKPSPYVPNFPSCFFWQQTNNGFVETNGITLLGIRPSY